MSTSGGEYIAKIAAAYDLPDGWTERPLFDGNPIDLGLGTVSVYKPTNLYHALTRLVLPTMYEFEDAIVTKVTGRPPLNQENGTSTVDWMHLWFQPPNLYKAMSNSLGVQTGRLSDVAAEVLSFSEVAISKRAVTGVFGEDLDGKVIHDSTIPVKVTANAGRRAGLVGVCLVGLHARQSKRHPGRAFVVGRAGVIPRAPGRVYPK